MSIKSFITTYISFFNLLPSIPNWVPGSKLSWDSIPCSIVVFLSRYAYYYPSTCVGRILKHPVYVFAIWTKSFLFSVLLSILHYEKRKEKKKTYHMTEGKKGVSSHRQYTARSMPSENRCMFACDLVTRFKGESQPQSVSLLALLLCNLHPFRRRVEKKKRSKMCVSIINLG